MTKSNVRAISGEIYPAFIILRILKLDIFRFSHHHPRNLNCLARNRLTSDMHETRHIFSNYLASFILATLWPSFIVSLSANFITTFITERQNEGYRGDKLRNYVHYNK